MLARVLLAAVADNPYGYSAYGSSNLSLTKTAAGFSANTNLYRYVGQRFDTGSNTVDFNARRYSPAIQRFVQRDSYFAALGDLGLSADPLNGNRYVLTGANPINFVDRDGHWIPSDDPSDPTGQYWYGPAGGATSVNGSTIHYAGSGGNGTPPGVDPASLPPATTDDGRDLAFTDGGYISGPHEAAVAIAINEGIIPFAVSSGLCLSVSACTITVTRHDNRVAGRAPGDRNRYADIILTDAFGTKHIWEVKPRTTTPSLVSAYNDQIGYYVENTPGATYGFSIAPTSGSRAGYTTRIQSGDPGLIYYDTEIRPPGNPRIPLPSPEEIAKWLGAAIAAYAVGKAGPRPSPNPGTAFCTVPRGCGLGGI